MSVSPIIIFDQWKMPECKGYWFLTALKILKPSIDHEEVIRAINENPAWLITNRKAGEFFKSRWFIKDYKDIGRSILLKGRLNRHIPIVSTAIWVDWEATNKPPYIAKFTNKVNPHNITAVWFDNKTRLIKIANTWWTGWWDKWFYYIHADDLSRLMDFCELIV